jgi:hypothetical protein
MARMKRIANGANEENREWLEFTNGANEEDREWGK